MAVAPRTLPFPPGIVEICPRPPKNPPPASIVNAATAPAATDPSVEAVDVAVTGSVVATALMANTDTTAKAKPKVKVKKEMTAAEGEVQNQKHQARWVAQRMRKAEAITATLEEERWERLTIMAARAQAQEAMKLWQLIGEGKTDTVAGAALSSSVTSQVLCPPMLLRSPAMPRAATPRSSPGPRVVPVWRRAIIIAGAAIDDGRGHNIANQPQPGSYSLGLCLVDADAPSGAATNEYHSSPCPIRQNARPGPDRLGMVHFSCLAFISNGLRWQLTKLFLGVLCRG
jgi:hypothetical protein